MHPHFIKNFTISEKAPEIAITIEIAQCASAPWNQSHAKVSCPRTTRDAFHIRGFVGSLESTEKLSCSLLPHLPLARKAIKTSQISEEAIEGKVALTTPEVTTRHNFPGELTTSAVLSMAPFAEQLSRGPRGWAGWAQ
jgi:hypothetical protein